MTINNKLIGTPTGIDLANTGNVLPKLVDHNTTEQRFQEGIHDVAVQVDQTQADVGYNSDLTVRTGTQATTVHNRLTTLEDTLLTTGGGIGGTLTTSDISGTTLANARLNQNSVTTDEVLQGSLRADDIAMRGMEVGGATNEGIVENQISTALDHTITVGEVTTVSVTLGDDYTLPLFATDTHGVVDAPVTAEATDADTNLYVLGSDNNWHRLNEFVRHGQLVPEGEVNRVFQSIPLSRAVPAGTDRQAYLASAARNAAVESGDVVVLTDTTPNPDQQIAYFYVGAPLAATAAGAAGDFVPLGVAASYGTIDNGGLTLDSQNNFGLLDTIPGDRTFSGATTLMGGVAGDIVPTTTTGTQALGTTANRWDVVADSVTANSINVTSGLTGMVTDANFADNSIDPSRLMRGMPGEVLTTSENGMDVAFSSLPPGVQMVTMLPATVTAATAADIVVAQGTVVSLTAANAGNEVGVYRAEVTGDAITWRRLGTVNAILSTETVNLTASASAVTFNLSIPSAHFITADGLVLVLGTDYTVNATNPRRIDFAGSNTLDSGVDVVLHAFGDVATLGAGEVATTALAPGALPSMVTIDGGQVTSGTVPEATRALNASLANTFQIGGWTLSENASGGLDFNRGTDTVFRITTAGALEADGDITAFSDQI